MARLAHVDASFLAGEVDPAIAARLDDVVRANGASRVRNMYVRSMGGVRTRPGMRVAARFEGRQFSALTELSAVTVRARRYGGEGEDPGLAVVSLAAPRFVPPWERDDNVQVEIDFGRVLPAGTTVALRVRNEDQAPDNWVTRLYWWEHKPDRPLLVPDPGDGAQTGESPVGRWRSGGGLPDADGNVGTREAWRDIAFVNSRAFRDYEHTLVEAADKVQLRRRDWHLGTVGRGGSNAYGLQIARWSGEFDRGPGQGSRQVVRLLDVSWREGVDLLLALHGAQSTLFRGSEPDALEYDPPPLGYSRETGFTDEVVRTMQAHRAPEGVYLHSPLQPQWQPWRLGTDRETQAVALGPAPIKPPGTFEREGEPVDGWGPFYPASSVLPYQGRLLVAGTGNAPNGLWASKAGDRTDFIAPEITQSRQLLATDTFMVQETGRPLNRIVAMHGGLLLVFFGNRGISFSDRPYLSALDFGFRENAERGIKEGVPPIEIGTGRLAFVDASGQSVWLMTYANERQGYVFSELSQVAPHLLDEPEDLIWYEGLPEGGTAAIVVNADGSLACCAIQPEGEWHAWSLWTSHTDPARTEGDIEDVEAFAGGLWAVTRRGAGAATRALYLERFDPEVELDFCSVTEDGSHRYPAAYESWAAVAEMRDGSRRSIGLRLVPAELRERRRAAVARGDDEAVAGLDARIEAIEQASLDGNDVRTGVANLIGTAAQAADDEALRDRRLRLGVDFDASDVVRWQVGQPFDWQVCTMPFVKRTQRGNTFQSPSRTTECYVNQELRPDRPDFEGPRPRRGERVRFTVNGRQKPHLAKLFSQSPIRAVGHGRFEVSQRFVNVVGWYDQNQICLDGRGDVTITSLSRTVMT